MSFPEEAIDHLYRSGIDSQSQRPFPLPDWERISENVDSAYPQEQHDRLWGAIASRWMRDVSHILDASYKLEESATFILISAASTEEQRRTLMRCEHYLKGVCDTLEFVNTATYGKLPVILFATHDDFCRYLAAYTQEDGNYASPAGVYLNRGYGHVIAVEDELRPQVLCHEIIHSRLSHLPLPLWLNEAFTAEIKHSVVGSNPYHLDHEMVRRHQAYWTPEKIEGFWQGDSFHYPDEGQELSYHLARFLLNGLLQDSTFEERSKFIQTAHWNDSGFSAAQDILGISPGEVVDSLLET